MKELKKVMQDLGWKQLRFNGKEVMWQKNLSDRILLEAVFYKSKDSCLVKALELVNPENKQRPIFEEIHKFMSKTFEDAYAEVVDWLTTNKKI